MNHQINRLIYFGLQHHLISEDDEIYAVNLLLDLFHLDHFTKEEMSEELEVADRYFRRNVRLCLSRRPH